MIKGYTCNGFNISFDGKTLKAQRRPIETQVKKEESAVDKVLKTPKLQSQLQQAIGHTLTHTVKQDEQKHDEAGNPLQPVVESTSATPMVKVIPTAHLVPIPAIVLPTPTPTPTPAPKPKRIRKRKPAAAPAASSDEEPAKPVRATPEEICTILYGSPPKPAEQAKPKRARKQSSPKQRKPGTVFTHPIEPFPAGEREVGFGIPNQDEIMDAAWLAEIQRLSSSSLEASDELETE